MEELTLTITGVEVLIQPIAAALGVSRKRAPSALDLEALQRWLAALKPASEVLQHFQDHLCAFIKEKSTSMKVQRAVENSVNAPGSEKVILIGHELDSTDHFRRDASRGASKLAPDAIDKAARTGCVDLFVRPPSVWEDSPSAIQRMSIDMAAYRPSLLQDYRRGNVEVLSGPQMVERYPDSPLVKRKTVPERWSVEDGVLVHVPAHPQRFPWEV